jgi:hypothetical protein
MALQIENTNNYLLNTKKRITADAFKVQLDRLQNSGWQNEQNLGKVFWSRKGTNLNEDFDWLKAFDPHIAEWKGEKKVSTLPDGVKVVYPHIPYYMVIAFKEAIFTHGSQEDIKSIIDQAVKKMLRYPFKQVGQAYNNVLTTTLGYDGLPLCSSGRWIDNIVTGTGFTTEKLRNDIGVVIARAKRYTMEDSTEELDIAPNVILCPPELQEAFTDIVKAKVNINISVAGTVNQHSDIEVVSTAKLSDTNDWMFIETREGNPPIGISNLGKAQMQWHQTSRIDKGQEELHIDWKSLLFTMFPEQITYVSNA